MHRPFHEFFWNVKPSFKQKIIHVLGIFQLHAGVIWHQNMLLVAN
jgi:hypothetical protein